MHSELGHKDHPLVCLHEISFGYGEQAVLEDIDLHVEKGEYLGLLGPNGSGKSTLLKIILGLLTPEKGKVELFGKPINKFSNWHKIGYIPQKATQIENRFPITVKEVVSINARSQTKVSEALEKVDMLSFSNNLVHELSGGQQQRVFIAKALAGDPQLLLLDEPTVGIDANSQKDFYSLLDTLHKSGLTIVLVSHDTEDIVREVNRIVCVNKRLVCHVTPKEFVAGNYYDKLYGEDRKTIIHRHSHA